MNACAVWRWSRRCAAVTMGVIVTVLSLGPMAAPVPLVSAQAQGMPEYVLAVGDTVEVIVLGEPDLTRTIAIRPDGRITLPLIGEVLAAGLTPTQLAERIAAMLRAYLKDPRVTVQVPVFQRAFVYLVGQVNRIGAVEIQRGWTLLEVISTVGGVTPRAALRRVTVIRRGTGQTIPVDLDRLLKGDRSADVTLEPGDIIMVPTLQNRVLILGAVRSPGAYDVDEGARFLDAIALAGGPADRSASNNIGLIRTGPDGRPVVTQIDFNKMVRGDMTQNVVLQNADVIFVPQGPLVRWQDILAWLSGLGLIRSLAGI